MLGHSDLVGFVATTDLERAADFYGTTLGLERRDTTPIAVVFDANGTSLRVTLVDDLSPKPFTVLGWSVSDIEQYVQALTRSGVVFERFPGMDHDALGIWTSPSGDQVAWFKDPDGNVLSLTQPAE
jgi:catechol 2,3-dioxygenase-like lactoylglutathione lyase family enzyme